jgi:hypothetical protein
MDDEKVTKSTKIERFGNASSMQAQGWTLKNLVSG